MKRNIDWADYGVRNDEPEQEEEIVETDEDFESADLDAYVEEEEEDNFEDFESYDDYRADSRWGRLDDTYRDMGLEFDS